MIGHGGWGGGGGRCQNAPKQYIIKTYQVLILYKPLDIYNDVCQGFSYVSAYQVINCLISQPKHMLWVLKRTVTMTYV